MGRSIRVSMPIFFYCFCVVFSMCFGRVVFAAEADNTAAPQTLEELKAAIEKVRVESGLPGLGIAIVDKNGPIWIEGLGEANKEHHTPATKNTLFRIGSTSKMFVALSVMQLVEQGKLHLDDKLRDLAPEIYFDNPWEKTNPIRLVHLLEHTTGWDDISTAVIFHQSEGISLKEALDFKPRYRKSRWVPGTRFAYNNAGPGISAYIIEKVTGQRYEDYVQTHFFNPLQMTSATFFNSELMKQQGATLYSAQGKALPFWHIIMRPSGAISASTTDMAKYLQFLLARGQVDQQHLVSEASFTRMETPTTTLGAQAGTRSGYGLHNYVTGFEDYSIAFRGHDGDVEGGHCRLSYVPELQIAYVLMVNQDNMEALNKIPQLIRAYLLKDVHKPEQKMMALPKKFQDLSGYYIPIDSRSLQTRLLTEVFGVMKFEVSGNALHRSPVLGSWNGSSNDIAVSDNLLQNAWTGLPNIALVNDPLAGDVVEVSDAFMATSFKRVSAFRVFGVIGLLGVVSTLGISSLVFALVWSVRLLLGKIPKGAAISIRVWPLFTALLLVFGMLSPNMFKPEMSAMGEITTVPVIIFLSSLLYPFLAVYSLANIYRHRHAVVNRIMYWYSTVFSVVLAAVAVVLIHYDQFMIRLWV